MTVVSTIKQRLAARRSGWVGISGTAGESHPDLARDVAFEVDAILASGRGIVAGGAPGVDYLATKRALEKDPSGRSVRVILPTSLDTFASHFLRAAFKGRIDPEEAWLLVSQLDHVKKLGRLEEHPEFRRLTARAFAVRNFRVAAAGERLIGFQVNGSGGTGQTMAFARRLGTPVRHYSYTVPRAEDLDLPDVPAGNLLRSELPAAAPLARRQRSLRAAAPRTKPPVQRRGLEA